MAEEEEEDLNKVRVNASDEKENRLIEFKRVWAKDKRHLVTANTSAALHSRKLSLTTIEIASREKVRRGGGRVLNGLRQIFIDIDMYIQQPEIYKVGDVWGNVGGWGVIFLFLLYFVIASKSKKRLQSKMLAM